MLIFIALIVCFYLNIYQIVQCEEITDNFIYISSTGVGNFSTIQEGIDHANEGDTVYVQSGIYYENIVIDTPISLVGENNLSTIIDGRDVGNVIKINVDGVLIKGFTIQHSGLTYPLSGINLSANFIDITGNIIMKNFYGLTLNFSFNDEISGNIIQNNDHCGIYMSKSSQNTITNNTIQNHTYNGIGMYDSSDGNIIQRNFLSNNQYCGINIWKSSSNTITDNDIIDNNIGIRMFSSENTIKGNKLLNNNQDFDTGTITPGFPLLLVVFSVAILLYFQHKNNL